MPSYLIVGGLFLAGTAVDVVVAALAFRRRPAAGAAALAALALCTGLWTAGYGLEVAAPTVGAKLFWTRVEWIGSMGSTLAWLVFGLEYAGFDRYARPRYVAAAAIVPAVTVLVAWTNPVHLMVRGAALRHVGGLVLLAQDRGAWFYVGLAYGYAIATAGMALVAYAVASAASVYRKQALALTAAFLLPVLANLAYVLGGTRPVDPTPLAFTLSNAVALVAIDSLDLLDARPVPVRLASASAFEHVADGVVVVDTHDRVVRANQSARRILDDPPLVGQDIASLIDDWDAIADEGRGDAVFGTTHGGRTYDVSVGAVRDDHDRPLGRTVVFRDVTDSRLQLQRLDVLNRVLRHNVRTEMNLAYGYADLIRERVTDPELVDYTERIERHTLELVDVADSAQEIDRALDRETLDDVQPVADLVGEAATRVRSRHPQATIRVQTATRDARVGAVLESVVHALVENAVEHNEDGDAVVDVEARADDDTVTVRVSDNGPGIPEAERRVLAAGQETPLRHGSGLGLWLVSWATQTLDGTVDIDDNEPTGSVVTVTVPRLREENWDEGEGDDHAGQESGGRWDAQNGDGGRDARGGRGGDHDHDSGRSNSTGRDALTGSDP